MDGNNITFELYVSEIIISVFGWRPFWILSKMVDPHFFQIEQFFQNIKKIRKSNIGWSVTTSDNFSHKYMQIQWGDADIPSPFSDVLEHICMNGQLAVYHIKEWFSCKTRMPGTVKCRPTVAYWVQIDGINIATELITRYYLNGTLIQCCFNARPTSATLAQQWTNIE